jgi:hypothetical protein
VKEFEGKRLAMTEGLTMRDYFAAKAMQGLMARNWSSHKGTDEELIEVWAQSSYAVADAMLKAREQ